MKKRPAPATKDYLREFHEGGFAGAGAYRLGEYLFADKKYDPALIQFQASGQGGCR